MKLITLRLHELINETLNPNQIITDTNLIAELKNIVDLEIKAIKLSIYPGSPVITEQLANHLVSLSNTVNHYLIRQAAYWKMHIEAPTIRASYLFMLEQIEELLIAIEKIDNALYEASAVTHFASKTVRIDLKNRYRTLEIFLKSQPIGDELRNILLKGIFQRIYKNTLHRRDAAELKNLIKALCQTDKLDNEILRDLLIIQNFNIPEFFLYCVNEFKSRLIETTGLHEQLELTWAAEDRLLDLSVQTGHGRPSSKKMLQAEIQLFLNEKRSLIKQLIEMRRDALNDTKQEEGWQRCLINLPVPQFALLIRLFIETGLLLKDHVGEVFSFFAGHFYTANALFISPGSLQKKSTEVEFATAQKMKGRLIIMLNWLNQQYNLSSYQGS